MKKIAFVGNSQSADKLFDMFKRQTPGNLGIWGGLQGVRSYQEADIFGVIDELPQNLKHFEERSVFLGAHPPESHHAYRDMSKYKGIAKADLSEKIGFLEWWIKYDYDYLKSLKPMNKINDLGCIMSDAASQSYHKNRLKWLQEFTNKNNLDFNLHGRIRPFTENMKKYYRGACGSLNPSGINNDHMSGKESVYESHRYMIEFDAPGKFYMSERMLDCLLLWSYPIYWGGENIHQVIPKESFSYLDINGNGNDVLEIIQENVYEKALPYISEARQLLLDKWQLWPRIHELVFGKTK